ncbi:sensor histidine kinase [Microbacterium lacticum]
MSRASASPPPTNRYFGDSRCRSIWHWQLIIAFTTVAIAVGVAALSPERFSDWRFSVSVILIVAITMATLSIPWHRLGRAAVLAVPVLDALLIGLIVAGRTPAGSFLWVFPVAWVATYFRTVALVGMLSLIAGIELVILLTSGVTVQATMELPISVVALCFVGVIMSVGSTRNRSSRRLLSAQSDRLAHALERVQFQKARNLRVLDALDIGAARVSPGGAIEVASAVFRRLYALDSASNLHPARAVEYRTRRGEAVPASETTISRAGRGELLQDEVVWLFGVDGRWRALRASTKAIDPDDADDGLLLRVEDVTESIDPRAGEDAVRRSITHELRNPLTAVLGHVELLLERDDLDAAARRQLDVVEHAGARMEQLIDRALSVPGARDDDADEPFDLADIAFASVDGFTPAADASGVTVEVRLFEDLPVCGDAFRLRQVVDNVLGNAIKFAQRGGRVIVQGHREDTGGVQLLVTDNGIGIADDDLPRIFEREFRTELARQRGIPGTGLGLSISRDIVMSEGGRPEVTSELGQGTSVSIVLPTFDADRERMPA